MMVKTEVVSKQVVSKQVVFKTGLSVQYNIASKTQVLDSKT